MANEIRSRAELACSRLPGATFVAELFATQSGTGAQRFRQTFTTSEEAINVPADIATLGYFMAINRGANPVHLRRATGGAEVITLAANGGFCLFQWHSGVTAPFAISTGGDSDVEFVLLEA